MTFVLMLLLLSFSVSLMMKTITRDCWYQFGTATSLLGEYNTINLTLNLLIYTLISVYILLELLLCDKNIV